MGFKWIFCVIKAPGTELKQSLHVDGLVQERRNLDALSMELRFSCINPSICL